MRQKHSEQIPKFSSGTVSFRFFISFLLFHLSVFFFCVHHLLFCEKIGASCQCIKSRILIEIHSLHTKRHETNRSQLLTCGSFALGNERYQTSCEWNKPRACRLNQVEHLCHFFKQLQRECFQFRNPPPVRLLFLIF